MHHRQAIIEITAPFVLVEVEVYVKEGKRLS